MIRRTILALTLAAGIAPAFAQVPAPVPALPDTERRTSYTINASTCACTVNFALYGDSTDYWDWLEVWLNGVQVTYNDPALGWTITSTTGSLGSIALPITNAVLTFNSVQTGTVQIVGARRPRRTSQFNENSGVPTRNFNVVLSDLTAQNRETWDKINDVTGRVPRAPPGETLAPLPPASQRANMGVCFDSNGNMAPCVGLPSGSFAAGTGVTFTGTNPTTIAASLAPGSNINLTGTNPITISTPLSTPPGGRVTMQSGHPVQNADQNGVTSLYLDCYANNQTPVYNGTAFISVPITGCEQAIGLSTSNIIAGNVYEVFVTASGPCVGPAWSGPHTPSVAHHNTLGYYTNSGILTNCWGGSAGTTNLGPVAADRGTAIYIFQASANGQTTMNPMKPWVIGGGVTQCLGQNYYNAETVECGVTDAKSSWPVAMKIPPVQQWDTCNSASGSFAGGAGSISGTTLTVTGTGSGAFMPGQLLTATGATAQSHIIAYGGTGIGGAGTYVLDQSSTVGGGTPLIASADVGSFTAGISGTTLTVGSITYGELVAGQFITSGAAAGTMITGGSGTSWTVTPSQTVTTGTAMLTGPNPATMAASFLGSISGTTLTVSSVSLGTIQPNQYIFCPGCTAGATSGLQIVSGSGNTWTVSPGQGTLSSRGMTTSNLGNQVQWVDGLGTTFPDPNVLSSNGGTISTVNFAITMSVGMNSTLPVSNGHEGLGQTGGPNPNGNLGFNMIGRYAPYPTIGANTAYCIYGGSNTSMFGSDFLLTYVRLKM